MVRLGQLTPRHPLRRGQRAGKFEAPARVLTRHQQRQFALLREQMVRAPFTDSWCAQTFEPRTRATGQRFPSQEVTGRARVPTLMPGRRANARQAGHRAAFTGGRRPGSAALSLPPRATNPSRRSKVTVAIHPSCHAKVFWRAGEAHKDGRYAEDFGRTRAIALVGKGAAAGSSRPASGARCAPAPRARGAAPAPRDDFFPAAQTR